MLINWRPTFSEVSKQTKRFASWIQGPDVTHIPPPPKRVSLRSQLRFSPSRRLNRWTTGSLFKTHSLLRQGEVDAALKFSREFISTHREGWQEFVHTSISLFTRHRRFDAALSLCDFMVNDGFLLPNRTLMLLMRGVLTQDANYLERVSDLMTRNGTRLDNRALSSILEAMQTYRFSPLALDEALDSWQKTRGESWAPSISMFGTIIRAWALYGHTTRAELWLLKYRRTYRLGQNRPDTPSQLSSPDTSPPRETLIDKALPQERITSSEHPRYPYAAVLAGYAKSAVPAPGRVQRLIHTMRDDGVSMDITMCNVIIYALSRWGMMSRALNMFDELLKPESTIHPNVETFRTIFNGFNRKVRKGRKNLPQRLLPGDLSPRMAFFKMMNYFRTGRRPRSPLPNKNIISTKTLNCALKTFCMQKDYAAAWTVLGMFTWFDLVPDRRTRRSVVNPLLRRMWIEMSARNTTDVLWIDRFTSERRSTIVETAHKMMRADQLYMIGRVSLADMEDRDLKHFLKSTPVLTDKTAGELKFLAALLRSALQADLGFQTLTLRKDDADVAVGDAMWKARQDMIPAGRYRK